MNSIPFKIFMYRALLLAGLCLNVALFVYVYFMVDGGPASVHQDGGGWTAIFNEIPITFVFFLASVFKPYLMVWSKCRNDSAVITAAALVMLATTVVASMIAVLAEHVVMKNIVLYINWAFLWSVSAYFVLTRPRDTTGEH
jgi:hypothetical protein